MLTLDPQKLSETNLPLSTNKPANTFPLLGTYSRLGILNLFREPADRRKERFATNPGDGTARTSVLRPGRPIENRPQAESLPCIRTRRVADTRASHAHGTCAPRRTRSRCRSCGILHSGWTPARTL